MVSVDLGALRSIEREKEIPFEHLLAALETALLSAYKHTPHSMPHARVAIDRKTGDVVVWAQDLDEEGQIVEEYDDTPTGFGRVAAMTARQVILQRLRDAEHDQTFGEYSGREGDIVNGVVQADAAANARGVVVVKLDRVEAILPQSEQVPGEEYSHGTRVRGYVIGVTRGMRGPQVTLSRTHPNLVKKLFALEVSCTARRSTSSTGPRIRRPTSATRCRRPTSFRARSSTPSRSPCASSCRTSSCPSRSGGRDRTRGWRPG
jgi:N utilization substance protein A